MELWIRSQDRKKLINVNEVKMETVKDGNTFIYSHATDLGTYKTKERALEVLDDIQGKITQNECLKLMIPKLSNVKGEEEKIGGLIKGMIYEMPKE